MARQESCLSVHSFGDRNGYLIRVWSSARCWVLRDRAGWCLRMLVGLVTLDLVVSGRLAGRTGYRPYFENYTVDASILDTRNRSAFGSGYCVLSSYKIKANLFAGSLCNFVIKFLSANGECLGIWSRRRTYKSAISLGELIIEL